MTQKQIRRRQEAIDAKLRKLELQIQRLREELCDLQKQCAHSNRYMKSHTEQCYDCGNLIHYAGVG